MDRPPIKENTQRRSYSKQFKAELVAQCIAEEGSIAAIAATHGLNANLLQRWVSEFRRHGKHDLADIDVRPVQDRNRHIAAANWIPVDLPANTVKREVAPRPDKILEARPRTPSNAPTTRQTIALELSKRDLHLTLRWPGDDYHGLAGFVRELLR